MDVKTGNTSIVQFVTFSIASDSYGIDVSCVQEITDLPGITKVPDSKPFMKGVLDLRGIVVPLVDMRIRFGFEEKKYDSLTAVIIVYLTGRRIGIIVDSVSDVVSIPASEIQSTLHYPVKVDTDCVKGIFRGEKGIIVLLDSERVLDPETA